jgi:hypothetical protein
MYHAGMMTVAVLGATGRTGRPLVEQPRYPRQAPFVSPA